jgi:TonB-dependent SusC/RagA subfamily outer membrane receptor
LASDDERAGVAGSSYEGTELPEVVMRPNLRSGTWIPVVLLLLPAGARAQSGRQLAGWLTAREPGTPFAGAAIHLVGRDEAVCADKTGRFELKVPDGEARLRITPVGFPSYEVTIGSGVSAVELPLTDHVVVLKGVDVIGYSALSRTGASVARLDSTDLGDIPSQTVEGKLQGKVAGANIQANSGAPGGGYSIAFRGVKTILGDANPVIVVDGTIISNATLPTGVSAITGTAGESDNGTNRLADINPNDIASVEVLRGPSAAAMWGPRAGNGVVIITTKRGRRHEPSSDVALSLRCFIPA